MHDQKDFEDQAEQPEMIEAITHEIKGIQCDNPQCDWKDMEAEFDVEKWLNAPCPECGSNLFTDEAHAELNAMLAMVDVVNKSLNTPEAQAKMAGEPRTVVEITHNEKGLMDGIKFHSMETCGEESEQDNGE